jgi:hypothetical protein
MSEVKHCSFSFSPCNGTHFMKLLMFHTQAHLSNIKLQTATPLPRKAREDTVNSMPQIHRFAGKKKPKHKNSMSVHGL